MFDSKCNVGFKIADGNGFTATIYGTIIRRKTSDQYGIAIVQDKLVQFEEVMSDKNFDTLFQIVGKPIAFSDIFPPLVEAKQEDEDNMSTRATFSKLAQSSEPGL